MATLSNMSTASLWPMLTLRLLAIAILSVSVIAQEPTPEATPAPAIEPQPDPRQAAIDRCFAPWDRGDSPGAAVGVIQRGELLFARGYGLADLEHGIPIEIDTVFDLASVSKQFCAYAVALLAERGQLSLDDDVRRHLPWVPDFGAVITLRHLVHHTSGLRDWPATLAAAGYRYDDVIAQPQILELVRHQRRLNFAPGSKHLYSNTGYNLLAEVVAVVAGVDYRRFCDDQMFAPLAMHDTHVHDAHDEVVPRLARSYRREGGHWRLAGNHLTALGSSSQFSTVRDLARWASELEDGIVGGAAMVARMAERGVLGDGSACNYGFGLQSGRRGARPTVSHSGSWAGYRSCFLRLPEQGLTVVVLANASNLPAVRLAEQVADLWLDGEVAAAPEPKAAAPAAVPSVPAAVAPAPSARMLDAAVGTYRSEELDCSYRIERVGEALVLRHRRTGEHPLRPLAADRFAVRLPGITELRLLLEGDAVVGFALSGGRVVELAFARVAAGQ